MPSRITDEEHTQKKQSANRALTTHFPVGLLNCWHSKIHEILLPIQLHAMLVLRRTICYNKNSLKSAGLSSLRRLQQRSVDPTAIVYGIIGLNISVYGVWQYAQSDSKLLRFMYNNFTTSTSHVLKNGKFHTVITSVFSHNDGWHIAANMISLYFFGLETAMILGASRFLALYMCGGTISSIAYILWPF